MALGLASGVTALRDLTQKFDKAVRAATPLYPQLATVVPSEGAEEKYGWLGEMPGMREWVGDRVFKDLRAATYELPNKHWESSLLIKKTDIADARLLKYGMLIDGLAAEASYHPDELLFQVLEAGEATAGFDGQFFYDTDHAWGDSGSQSNDLTFTAATGTAPTAAEFRGAYNQAYAALLAFKGDNGKPFFRPSLNGSLGMDVLVMVPTAMTVAATEGLAAQFDASGNEVTILGKPTLMISPYLTDAAQFYVFNLNQPLKPFVFQAREPLSRQVKNMDDIEYKDAKFMTEARYNIGYLAWWNAILTTFT